MPMKIKIAIWIVVMCIMGGIVVFAIDYVTPSQTSNIQSSNEMEALFIKGIENAYASGQSDALNGDIRIKHINDSTVILIKNPWNTTNTVASEPKWNQWKNREIHVDKGN